MNDLPKSPRCLGPQIGAPLWCCVSQNQRSMRRSWCVESRLGSTSLGWAMPLQDEGSMADGRSAAGVSHYSRASRADSRLDRDLKDAIEMVKVSDNKIGALRKMHAQYLLKR